MIRYLDEPAELLPVAAREPMLGCMAMGVAVAFCGDPLAASIWLLADEDGEVTGAVGSFGGTVVVLTEGMEPTEELCRFVKLLCSGGAEGILCGERFGAVLKGWKGLEGVSMPVLKCTHAAQRPDVEFTMEPPRKMTDCWELLAAGDADFAASDKDEGLARRSRGVRRRQCTVLMIYDGERAAATAEITGRTENAGAISSVMTDPEHRGRGYASALVARLASELESEGRAAYIVPADDYAEKIYKTIGFERDYTQCYFKLGTEAEL